MEIKNMQLFCNLNKIQKIQHIMVKMKLNFYKNRLEVRDNEGQPIRQCDKFKETSNSSQIFKKDIEKMEDNVLNHTKQSSEDRGNYHEFKNRYKKSKS